MLGLPYVDIGPVIMEKLFYVVIYIYVSSIESNVDSITVSLTVLWRAKIIISIGLDILIIL